MKNPAEVKARIVELWRLGMADHLPRETVQAALDFVYGANAPKVEAAA